MYTGLMDNYKKRRRDRMQFFLCNDNIERCDKRTRRKWVVSRLDAPDIWPVKRDTNLTRKEIQALENGGFKLPQRQVIFPRRLIHN